MALAYGLGAALLGGLTLIVGRLGWLDPWFIRVFLALLAVARRSAPPQPAPGPRPTTPAPPPARDPLAWLFALLIAPFVLITLLGSMLPAIDFDVLEYHLQGPKEYLPGRPHRSSCRTMSTRTCRSTWRCSTCSACR